MIYKKQLLFMKITKLLLFILLLLPAISFAQATSLVNFTPGGQDTLAEYVNILYVMSISIAALLAVIKIIIAGVKYMMSDVVTNKGDALSDIRGSLLGLLLIISSFLILSEINPTLTQQSISFNPMAMPDIPDAFVKADTPQQAQSDLLANTNSCLTSRSSLSQNGQNNLVTSSGAGCSAEVKNSEFATISSRCSEQGGTASRNESTQSITCALPIAGAANAASLVSNINSSGAAVDAEFIKQQGKTVNIDIAGDCSKRFNPESNGNLYQNCLTNKTAVVTSQCTDKYGTVESARGAVKCTVPREAKPISELTDAFKAWQAEDPTRQGLTLGGVGGVDVSVERELCKKTGGEHVDDTGPWNTCVYRN